METHELVIEMKLLERRLTLYEEKYGIHENWMRHFHAALDVQRRMWRLLHAA